MKFYQLSTKLTFGKNAGKTLSELICTQPDYIVWCLQNLPDFIIVIKTIEEIEEKFPASEIVAIATAKWSKLVKDTIAKQTRQPQPDEVHYRTTWSSAEADYWKIRRN